MIVNKVWAMYFSATGTTRKVVEHIAGAIGEKIHSDISIIDFTLPDARKEKHIFGAEDLVVFGTPVYAGRVPNVLLPFLKEKIEAKGAIAIPVVLFGNRAYDDALIELRNILEADGFYAIAAGAFVGEHSFSRKLAAGRPDMKDMLAAGELAEIALKRIAEVAQATDKPVHLKGEEPLRPYYTPRDRKGEPVNILKVKPKTNDGCTKCGICARICPMGSISHEDVSSVEGICIKCGACIKKCPVAAKYFDDEGYLYHLHELEEAYSRRAEPEIF
ncbi:MAG TPA: EFR1 family ferrodoxin [Clostridia bacterium]|nr:EFR1 family ferrodoxin [Clostridia bacterium]